VDLLGDGYVPIYDEWFAWLATVGGARVGNAIRYLDTNTYYHRWHLVERPRRLAPGPAVAAYRRATAMTDRQVKPCLFGPYTIWAYALKEGPGAAPGAFEALVDVWAAEVADLTAAGATYVQLDESVLLRPRHRTDLPLVRRAVERIAAAAPRARLLLHLAGGEIGDLLHPLLDLPVAGLGIDLTEDLVPSNVAALRSWPADRLLQAGVVNAREIRVETADALRQSIATITESLPPERCLLAPSTALLYLPRHTAFEKLTALAREAHAYEGPLPEAAEVRR
jgi:5-methyltetrahydropteroyltriglutamate--homocysteine methyltransferase